MKATIMRALAAIGLASTGQLQQLTGELGHSVERVRKLEERIARLREDAETWKRRHDEAAATVREWKETASHAEADAQRLHAGAEHAKARATEWKARADALAMEKRELRSRLEEVQRAAITAREYVMATEAKLDLIEAALQVLDSRTREAAITHP